MRDPIHKLLSPNRTEEIGYDVWREYVLPPFLTRTTFSETHKPRVIVGGRGCGKTMLLRYLSHESTFSTHRNIIPDDAVGHVGLYWRSDTQFAHLMHERGQSADVWDTAFRHLAATVLGIEFLRSLQSISNSASSALSKEDVCSLDFSRLAAYRPDLPASTEDLLRKLEDCLAEFESWANNVRSANQPVFLPGDRFLRRMIALALEQVPSLKPLVYFVYIDEYENLAEYQQRIINTWLKHSEPPLIFNVATKRNGFKTKLTDGSESLSAMDDYRVLDLENFDLDSEFPLFAAEILLLRLKLGGVAVSEIDPDQLRDSEQLPLRKDPQYSRKIQGALRRLFPGLSQCDLAYGVFRDVSLKQRLLSRTEDALEKRGEARNRSKALIDDKFPEASVVVPALLNRQSTPIGVVATEFEKLTSGSENKFTGQTDWIHNNFVGCYLQLFDGLGRPCPFYGGFETFCQLARGNLRHFLELCYKTLSRLEGSGIGDDTVVPVEMQAESARQVASDLLPEIRSFGPQGNNLHTFVLRLGSLLSLSQQSPSQSEPERSHFSVSDGDSSLTNSEQQFLSEAVKWSVLFSEKGTKKKDVTAAEGVEYVLNPIYAPYFHISYRKKRKLELTASEVTALISGDYNAVNKLLRAFQKRWTVEISEPQRNLFSHLLEDGE